MSGRKRRVNNYNWVTYKSKQGHSARATGQSERGWQQGYVSMEASQRVLGYID